ncbi:hypothetical protein CMQ_308 [Grosmannia clavigera kw1407]|uniref:Uncharacterized protein n=1 Tax=Grosmannia clavigera (strain kw1407 / UAMH 11150) TaxID=655863 RepID=F0XQW1_GROCL|nr:uncharacterized protein CMQ_308 [Grosmannia clavigera kw1407]EFW99990.1 hypothetical protein CMQ_308 [Grosmannia clavigera kw1407]
MQCAQTSFQMQYLRQAQPQMRLRRPLKDELELLGIAFGRASLKNRYVTKRRRSMAVGSIYPRRSYYL